MIDTTHEAPELLPCPFCGGDAVVYAEMAAYPQVACDACGASHGKASSTGVQSTIAAWNTRSDDLVQAAVAAALREAIEIYRKLSEGSPVGASDGQTYHVRYVTANEFSQAILTCITPDAQAALDRVVAAERRDAIALVTGIVDDCLLVDAQGKIVDFEYTDFQMRIAAIRKGGE